MTDQHHPITPPPELRRQWQTEVPYQDDYAGREHWLIDRAAQWGYDQRGKVNEAELQEARDQELEACIAWFDKHIPGYELVADRLRAARRPKPPSLKEQALAAQQRMWDGGFTHEDWKLIRRALEALFE